MTDKEREEKIKTAKEAYNTIISNLSQLTGSAKDRQTADQLIKEFENNFTSQNEKILVSIASMRYELGRLKEEIVKGEKKTIPNKSTTSVETVTSEAILPSINNTVLPTEASAIINTALPTKAPAINNTVPPTEAPAIIEIPPQIHEKITPILSSVQLIFEASIEAIVTLPPASPIKLENIKDEIAYARRRYQDITGNLNSLLNDPNLSKAGKQHIERIKQEVEKTVSPVIKKIEQNIDASGKFNVNLSQTEEYLEAQKAVNRLDQLLKQMKPSAGALRKG